MGLGQDFLTVTLNYSFCSDISSLAQILKYALGQVNFKSSVERFQGSFNSSTWGKEAVPLAANHLPQQHVAAATIMLDCKNDILSDYSIDL